jgi:transcriptional regulator with XRE-family HTH domain
MQPDDVRSRIAAEVRAEMARQNRTQRALALAIGIDQASAGVRLQGKRPFKAEELVAVAAWLGVPIGQFTAVAA